MTPTKAELDTFWRSHDMSIAIARAALDFLGVGGSLDRFEYEVRQAYEQHCRGVMPDNIRPSRPSLRVVTSQGD